MGKSTCLLFNLLAILNLKPSAQRQQLALTQINECRRHNDMESKNVDVLQGKSRFGESKRRQVSPLQIPKPILFQHYVLIDQNYLFGLTLQPTARDWRAPIRVMVLSMTWIIAMTTKPAFVFQDSGGCSHFPYVAFALSGHDSSRGPILPW